MAIKRHSHVYQAGPTFPDAVGDRYYAQDLFRDTNFVLDDSGRKVESGYEAFPVLLKDSNITKGTLWTDLNIPIAKGIVEFEVDVPNSYAALPPTVTQEDIYVRIVTAAETDFDISGTATLDGVTVNYVKVTYTETDGSSRTRAKKAGTYVYEKAVSYTITVSSAAPTNKDLVLGTVVGDGAASLIITSYPRTRHYGAAYDYVVDSQADFNIIIDYTAANQYRIKDSIKSIYVRFLAGGYQMTGATSPLQEGDLYGYIETNDCTRIVFEPGAFVDMHQNIGYIEVDTDYCYLDGVSVQGDKGAASAIVQSFLLNANYVIFHNCDSQLRLSNTTFQVFKGSGTAKHNESSEYIDCHIEDCDSTGNIAVFYECKNIKNAYVNNVEYTGGGATNTYLIQYCDYIDGITITNIASDSTGNLGIFRDCDYIDNVYIKTIDATSGVIIGFYDCTNVINIYAEDFDATAINGTASSGRRFVNVYFYDFNSTAGVCYGFSNIRILSNCHTKQLDATGNCYAFYSSDDLSSCYAEDIDSSGANAYGYYDCENISGSFATTCDDGFNTCKQVSACASESNSNDGFFSCNRVSGCFATTNGNDGYEDCNVIAACSGNSNTGNGFDGCKNMTANRATGNTAANYVNSFADWAGTQACADTSAGGYNS